MPAAALPIIPSGAAPAGTSSRKRRGRSRQRSNTFATIPSKSAVPSSTGRSSRSTTAGNPASADSLAVSQNRQRGSPRHKDRERAFRRGFALSAEQYLNPSVIRNVARLDLRARFIVEGFLSGLHKSPFHGFSVEFSEHRRYSQGDDPNDIDWLVYAKTDRYYVKKYEAETNISGYLLMDLSESMAYTHRQELTK